MLDEQKIIKREWVRNSEAGKKYLEQKWKTKKLVEKKQEEQCQ